MTLSKEDLKELHGSYDAISCVLSGLAEDDYSTRACLTRSLASLAEVLPPPDGFIPLVYRVAKLEMDKSKMEALILNVSSVNERLEKMRVQVRDLSGVMG